MKVPARPPLHRRGASDTAALFSVGAFAIGRSSAAGSGAQRIWLKRFVAAFPKREIIVVGDRDGNGIGMRSAESLAKFLQAESERPIARALPREAYKDVREQVVAGNWTKGLHLQEKQP